jgi:hypothetical protein
MKEVSEATVERFIGLDVHKHYGAPRSAML